MDFTGGEESQPKFRHERSRRQSRHSNPLCRTVACRRRHRNPDFTRHDGSRAGCGKGFEGRHGGNESHQRKKAAQREAANKLKREETGIKAAARQEYTRPATTNLQVRPGLVKRQSVNQSVEDAKAKLDSKNEMGETESLRMQMAMDRLSKLEATLSNLLKKVSETQSNIVNNLK
ncbi:MAG: hypothetical protein WCJ07_00795 [Verrucomicrobiota bacterium]